MSGKKHLSSVVLAIAALVLVGLAGCAQPEPKFGTCDQGVESLSDMSRMMPNNPC